MNFFESSYKDIWENLEEYKCFPFSPFYKLIPLKRLLAGLKKNAMKDWKEIKENEIKLKKFIDIYIDYEEIVSAKGYCSDFDDNETIRNKMNNQKYKIKKYEEKMKRYNKLLEERNKLEAIIKTGISRIRVNEAKRRIDRIEEEMESIRCYIEENRPDAFIYNYHQRNRAVNTLSDALVTINEMNKAVEQFQDSIQSANEKLAYLFTRFFKKIEINDYDYLPLYFSMCLHKTSLYLSAPRFTELSYLRGELDKLASELPTLFDDEINQINEADKRMITGIYKLTNNKTSANKIAMKLYECANNKQCPIEDNETWSTARHILENYIYPKTWRRKSTHKLILNEHSVKLIKISNITLTHVTIKICLIPKCSSESPKFPTHPIPNPVPSYSNFNYTMP